jgi:hypothetical protein
MNILLSNGASRILVTPLNINYHTCILNVTLPHMKEFAEEIGADFHVQTQRLFSNFPITVEKFYLYHIAEQYDYILFFDADLLVNPMMAKNILNLMKMESDAIIVPEHLDPPHQFNEKLIQYQCPLYFSLFHRDNRKAFEPFWKDESFTDSLTDSFMSHIHDSKDNKRSISKDWFMDELLYNYNIMRHKIPTVSFKETIFMQQQNFAAHTTAELSQKINFLRDSARTIALWREIENV